MDLLHACTRCGAPRLLLVRLGADDWLCAACWRAAGEPSGPRHSPEAVFAREQLTRDQMRARGGTDRHLVRNGLS
jgi:ribosomal protein L37AE/L43A